MSSHAKDSADFKVRRMAERQAKFWNEQFDFDADIQKDLDEDACFDWLISSDEVMQSGCLDFISPTDRIMVRAHRFGLTVVFLTAYAKAKHLST